MKLPENKRYLFKKPAGKLFKNLEKALEYLNSINYEKIITVGDVVSADFLRNGIKPDIVIADFKTKRSPADVNDVKTIQNYSIPAKNVKNPSGQISNELWESIENANPPVKIIVDGEEDMATVPAVILAPKGSIIAYGQPKEGLVLLEVTEEKKNKFKKLIDILEEN